MRLSLAPRSYGISTVPRRIGNDRAAIALPETHRTANFLDNHVTAGGLAGQNQDEVVGLLEGRVHGGWPLLAGGDLRLYEDRVVAGVEKVRKEGGQLPVRISVAGIADEDLCHASPHAMVPRNPRLYTNAGRARSAFDARRGVLLPSIRVPPDHRYD